MDILVITYGVYLAISIALTIWVARTLFKHGAPFLVDVFKGNKELAGSVNHLLVVGFYLINLGYVSLALKLDTPPTDAASAIEALSMKIGLVLLVLGGMHFANLVIFQRVRQSSKPKFATAGPVWTGREWVYPERATAGATAPATPSSET